MEISNKVRNVLCALVRLSRKGYTMKEYMFYHTNSLSGMYEKMVDGLQFPQTGHLQNNKGELRDYLTEICQASDETKDLSKIYDLVCECWKDEEKFGILFELFFVFPGHANVFVFDHVAGETLTLPEERTLKELIGHAVRTDKTSTLRGVVDLIMGYLTDSHSYEEDLKLIGILDVTALMKFPMTSSDRQVRKVVIRAVEDYIAEQEQEVTAQTTDTRWYEDTNDFIIEQINLKPGVDPDPELEQYLEDEKRVLELIQTHGDPKIWGKFFNPQEVLETLRNRYIADTDRDEYIATQINQPEAPNEVRMGLFLIHDQDRVLNVIREHKSVDIWGSATPEEILETIKAKYGMKSNKKEENMNAQRINLHGLTIEEAMAAIQKAVPEIADRLFIKEVPVAEAVVNDLYQTVVALEEESNNKVIPQDIKQLMQNVYVVMQKVSYTDLLKELGTRLVNPNLHPKAAQRMGYVAGLISAAHHTLVNKERVDAPAVDFSPEKNQDPNTQAVKTCHQLIKSILKDDPSPKQAKVAVSNLITKYGAQAVYSGMTGMSRVSLSEESLVDLINKMLDGMYFSNAHKDSPETISLQELVEREYNRIMTTSKSGKEATELVRKLMDSYGIKAVYIAAVGTEPPHPENKHQMSATIAMCVTTHFPINISLNGWQGNTIPGMIASPDELNRVAHKLTMVCGNYCCSTHFTQALRNIHQEHGAELMRTVIGMYQIGTNLQHHGSAESYVNDWAQKFITDKRNNQPQGGSYNRSAPTGNQFRTQPTMRAYASVEEMVRDIGFPGCANI